MADAVVAARFGAVLLAASGALALGLGACSGDAAAKSCVSAGGGQVCVVREDGTPTLEVDGLQPGSEVRATWEGGGEPQIYLVDESGELDGTISYVTWTQTAAVQGEVVAIAADGSPIEGTISLPAP
jgi:hypothetical protein